jgi:DNA repair exonuclease SbcCD ATPase subunit
MRDESPLVALGLDLRDALGIMQSAEKQVGLMAELRAPPEESGEGATELKEMVEELLEEQEQMTQLESELAGVTAEESKAGAAVALRQREMGKCPLCGAAFEEGHEHPGRGEINS